MRRAQFDAAWRKREKAAEELNAARKQDDRANLEASTEAYRAAQREIDGRAAIRDRAVREDAGQSGIRPDGF